MSMMKIDSGKVQALMLEQGIGVIELAERAKISAKTVSALHRRDCTIYIPTLTRLARALQVEPLKLIKAAS